MSETWADVQFDMRETVYDEVPIEAKARIAELERENEEMLEAWANQAATIKEQIDGLNARDELIREILKALSAECKPYRINGLPEQVAYFKAKARNMGCELGE